MRIAPDQLDRESVRDLQTHRGYALVRQRQEVALKQLMAALRTVDTWEATIAVRAKLEQLEADMQMPAQIEREIARSRQKDTA